MCLLTLSCHFLHPIFTISKTKVYEVIRVISRLLLSSSLLSIWLRWDDSMIERNPAGTASMHRLPQESWIGSFIIVPYTQLTRLKLPVLIRRSARVARDLEPRSCRCAPNSQWTLPRGCFSYSAIQYLFLTSTAKIPHAVFKLSEENCKRFFFLTAGSNRRLFKKKERKRKSFFLKLILIYIVGI